MSEFGGRWYWSRRVDRETIVARVMDLETYLRMHVPVPVTEQAYAFQRVMAALEPVTSAVVLIGNLLVVKHATQVVAKTLSQAEMIAIDSMPGILKDPGAVLELLALSMAGDES